MLQSVYWSAYEQNGTRKNYLEPGILTRHFRLRPLDYDGAVAMRWDVLGCPGRRSYQNVGCYADDLEVRDLPNAPLDDYDGGMTHEVCVHHCYDYGYLYAGTQYGSECWCGNSYGRYGASSGCDMACSGNPYQLCGGIRANWVTTTGMGK